MNDDIEWQDPPPRMHVDDNVERARLVKLGLLPDPEGHNEAAQWVGLPVDPTRLEEEYQILLPKLARELERVKEHLQRSLQEGSQLRATCRTLRSGLDYLREKTPHTPPQVEMIEWLVNQ